MYYYPLMMLIAKFWVDKVKILLTNAFLKSRRNPTSVLWYEYQLHCFFFRLKFKPVSQITLFYVVPTSVVIFICMSCLCDGRIIVICQGKSLTFKCIDCPYQEIFGLVNLSTLFQMSHKYVLCCSFYYDYVLLYTHSFSL